jgi:hypothetical protein
MKYAGEKAADQSRSGNETLDFVVRASQSRAQLMDPFASP